MFKSIELIFFFDSQILFRFFQLTALQLGLVMICEGFFWPNWGFLESVYSFVFGDGDPNSGREERQLAAVAASARQNGGVLTAEQMAPLLDPPECLASGGTEASGSPKEFGTCRIAGTFLHVYVDDYSKWYLSWWYKLMWYAIVIGYDAE